VLPPTEIDPCLVVVPEFAATVNPTWPLPAPLAPAVMAIQGVPVDAVHVHSAAVATDTAPGPPAAAIVSDEGASVVTQTGRPSAWVTVTVCPATRTDPVRDPPALGLTVSRVVPFPLPSAPDATSIHGASLAAVQLQPSLASTVMVTSPPPGGTVELTGETVNRHGAASCDTATAASFTFIVPLRGDGAVFAATR
jgi:hypothetical protein